MNLDTRSSSARLVGRLVIVTFIGNGVQVSEGLIHTFVSVDQSTLILVLEL